MLIRFRFVGFMIQNSNIQRMLGKSHETYRNIRFGKSDAMVWVRAFFLIMSLFIQCNAFLTFFCHFDMPSKGKKSICIPHISVFPFLLPSLPPICPFFNSSYPPICPFLSSPPSFLVFSFHLFLLTPSIPFSYCNLS
jgi:hypothetical protein